MFAYLGWSTYQPINVSDISLNAMRVSKSGIEGERERKRRTGGQQGSWIVHSLQLQLTATITYTLLQPCFPTISSPCSPCTICLWFQSIFALTKLHRQQLCCCFCGCHGIASSMGYTNTNTNTNITNTNTTNINTNANTNTFANVTESTKNDYEHEHKHKHKKINANTRTT